MTLTTKRIAYRDYSEVSSRRFYTSATSVALGILLILSSASFSLAQAAPTAERQINVQIGGSLTVGSSGISRNASVLYGRCTGGAIYSTIDPHPRFGVELVARQISGNSISERTFLAGPRYHRPYRSYVPYAKLLVGRGVFQLPNSVGNLSLTTIAPGGGVDYRVNAAIHARIDYEYQYWLGFADRVHGFPGAFSPQVLSIGIAYHIK